jgi:hypothetical protein
MTSATQAPWNVRPWAIDGEVRGFRVVDAAGNLVPMSDLEGDFQAAEANARLFSAAPELLGALEDVCAWLKATPQGYETVPPDSMARALAAIAKAVSPR